MLKFIKLAFIAFLTLNLSLSIQAQDLEWRISQVSLQGDTLYFYVDVRSNMAGTFLNDLSIYLTYNPDAFGTSVIANNRAVITPMGPLVGYVGNNPMYAINPVDNTPSKMAVIASSNFSGVDPDEAFHKEMPIAFTHVLEVKLYINDASELAGISFDENLMNGESFYLQSANNPVAYGNPSVYENDLINEPLADCNTSITSNVTQPDGCDEDEGTIVTNVVGTSPYIYTWSNSETTASISNLSAGVYTVTVTDANGCSASHSVALSTIVLPPFSINGSTTVFAGDTSTYTYPYNAGTIHDVNVNPKGEILSQGDGMVEVQWNSIGTGTLTIVETDTNTGCSGDPITLNVNILDADNTIALNAICNGMITGWTSPATTTSTKVYRSTNEDAFAQVGVSNSSSSYSDYIPNNQEGDTICYYVEHLLQDGSSIVSDTLCETALVVPQSAPILSVGMLMPNSVELSWASENPTLEYGFIILQNNSPIDTVYHTVSDYTVTGLQPNTNYSFRVLAHNECGDKGSNVINVKTLSDCQAPTDLAVTAVSRVHVDIDWEDNCLSEDKYQVMRINDATGEIAYVYVPSNATHYTDNTAEPNTNYCYVVNASINDVLSNPTDTVCVLTPSDCSYNFVPTPIECSTGTFTLTLSIDANICNVNGFNFPLYFNQERYQLESIEGVGDYGIEPYMIDFNTFVSSTNSLEVNVSLNEDADTNTFCGTGDIFKIKFSLIGDLPSTQDTIEVSNLLETRVGGGITWHCVDEGLVLLPNTETANGVIVYAKSGELMGYVESQPITIALGTSSEGGVISPTSYLQDEQGGFSIPISDGNHLALQKDISNTINMLKAINSADILTVLQLSLGQVSIGLYNELRPAAVLDFLIADVDGNGLITAGDVTLVNQRALSIIGEFPNGGRDWIFIDSLTYSKYLLSANFPEDDGVGVSRYRVPKISEFIKIPSEAGFCTTYPDMVYYGYMLGNFDDDIDLTVFKGKKNEEVIFDIGNAFWNDAILSIPIYASTSENIYTFDFSGLFAHTVIEFKDVQFSNNEPPQGLSTLSNVTNENTLLFTSYATSQYSNSEENTPLFYLNLQVDNLDELSSLTDCVLQDFNALINGKVVPTIVEGCLPSMSTSISVVDLNVGIYPNPTDFNFTIDYRPIANQIISMELLNVNGQMVKAIDINSNGQTTVPVIGLPNGIYNLKIVSKEGFDIERIVIMK